MSVQPATFASASQPQRLLLLADDDELSRQVLALIASEAGFAVQTFESGDALLLSFGPTPDPPAIILTDMQMPGTAGAELARQLRTLFPAATPRLLAMSGSPVPAAATAAFDGFLLKPFSSAALFAACKEPGLPTHSPLAQHPVLNQSIYTSLLGSIAAPQLHQLYDLCLTDALRRLQTMRDAHAINDEATYRGAAHAIKGSCGMVGASELAYLAGQMEEDGLHAHAEMNRSQNAAIHLDDFAQAAERLRRMLYEKELEVHAVQAGFSRPA